MSAPLSLRRVRSRADDGVTTVEYAILAGFIAVVIAVAIMALGETVHEHYQNGDKCFQYGSGDTTGC